MALGGIEAIMVEVRSVSSAAIELIFWTWELK